MDLNITSVDEAKNILNTLPIGIYRTGLDGKFIFANKECANLLGIKDTSEFNNIEASVFYQNPADREKFIKTLKRKKELKNYELALVTKDGKEIWVAATAKLCDSYLEGSLMDITEKKSLEEQVEKHKAAEAANLAELAKIVKKRVNEMDHLPCNIDHLPRKLNGCNKTIIL